MAGEGRKMNRRSAILFCLLLPMGLSGCVIAEEGGYRRGYGAREYRREGEDRHEDQDRHARQNQGERGEEDRR